MDFCLLLKTWAISIVKNLLTVQKNSTKDTIKTASKRETQKKADATGDLIGDELIKNNKSDKITNLSKNVSKELHSQNGDEIEIPKEG